MVALLAETLAIAHDLRLINTHCFGGRSCHYLQVEQRKGKRYSGGTIRQRRDWQNCLSKGLLQ